MVDEMTGCKVWYFHDTKYGMVEWTCAQFDKQRQAKKPVKLVWLDNAGENKKLQPRSDQAAWKLNTYFEYNNQMQTSTKFYSWIGINTNCCKINGNDESCQPKSGVIIDAVCQGISNSYQVEQPNTHQQR